MQEQTMRTLLRRCKRLLGRSRFERELAEEMETHRLMTERRLRDEGMSAADAAVASRRRMGNTTLAREELRGVWSWDALERCRNGLARSASGSRSVPAPVKSWAWCSGKA